MPKRLGTIAVEYPFIQAGHEWGCFIGFKSAGRGRKKVERKEAAAAVLLRLQVVVLDAVSLHTARYHHFEWLAQLRCRHGSFAPGTLV